MDIFEFARSLEAWVPLATVLNLLGIVFIGFLAFRRADVREHHRWLQEKRREAYVGFLSATRKASSSISAPQSGPKREREDAIDRDEEEVNYAVDVVAIVGPPHMATSAREVVARLKLDRLFYSPTREKQLADGRKKYIWRAVQTGSEPFAERFKKLYETDPVDVVAYEKLHDDFPLRNFWSGFTKDAEQELAKAHPGIPLLSGWWRRLQRKRRR